MAIPPPEAAVLPLMVELVIVNTAQEVPSEPLKTPPPLLLAILPEIVEFVIFADPIKLLGIMQMPAPAFAELFETAELFKFKMLPLTKMPPPLPDTLPPVMVRLLILTVTPPEILNTRLLLLPETDNKLAPGPVMVTPSVIDSSLVVSVMLPVTIALKIITSLPGFALAFRTACRREPKPASLVLVTVKLAAFALYKEQSKTKNTRVA